MGKPFYLGNREYDPGLDHYLQCLKGEKIALEICIDYYYCYRFEGSGPVYDKKILHYRTRLEEIKAQLEIINRARYG